MFKIGDRVFCIDNSEIEKLEDYGIFKLFKHKEYEVKFINFTGDAIRIDSSYWYYRMNRFLSVKEYRKLKLQNICLK